MSPVLIEILLWIIRIFRILLILRCLASCFVSYDSKLYRILLYITLPVTFFLTYPIRFITKKKKIFFDIDAFLVYVLLNYLNGIVMNTKVVMGLM